MIVGLILIGISLSVFGYRFWIKHLASDEARANHAYKQWKERRLAEGASYDDIHDEMHIREQLASLREVCTLHVMTVPNGKDTWQEVMKREITTSAVVLSALDPGLAKRFVRIVSGLRHSDILYPDAYDMVYPMPDIGPISEADRKRLARIRMAAFTDL